MINFLKNRNPIAIIVVLGLYFLGGHTWQSLRLSSDSAQKSLLAVPGGTSRMPVIELMLAKSKCVTHCTITLVQYYSSFLYVIIFPLHLWKRNIRSFFCTAKLLIIKSYFLPYTIYHYWSYL